MNNSLLRWWKVTPLLAAVIAASACNTKNNENSRDDFNPTPVAPQPGPQPKFGQVTQSLEATPPPISGGTLTVAKDGRTIIAADPDRDQIYVVDIPTRTIKHTIKTAKDAEPGRVAVSEGKAHVALRNSGGIVTIDLATGATTERRACIAPRGLAYDSAVDALHIACAEGVLVTMPLAGGELKKLALDKDLRDVVVTKSNSLVSRFRNADDIKLTRVGLEVAGKSNTHGGNLGWRMIASPTAPEDPNQPPSQEENDNEPALVSQDPSNPVGPVATGYYGSANPNDACISPTITPTRVDIPGAAGTKVIQIPPAVLPVDMATNGNEYAIVAAGNGHTSELPQIFVHQVKPRATSSSSSSSSGSVPPGFGSGFGSNPDCTAMSKGFIPGQAIAAAFDGENQLIVQSREPAALFIMSPDRQRVFKEIKLSDVSREDTGHAIFHSNSGGFLACASCHAEGGEDGRTWEFVEGVRRTPSMKGTIAHTAPFHWDGAMKDLGAIVDHVFVTRMSGPKIVPKEVEALQNYLFKMPAPVKLEKDLDKVTRGGALFQKQGCASCHSGAAFTNNESRDVGTGGIFQVPSLVGVAWRGPFLHNGCAKTLKGRFEGECGGAKHGDVTGLDAAQIEDLTEYLESL
jgi:hypothetical protein